LREEGSFFFITSLTWLLVLSIIVSPHPALSQGEGEVDMKKFDIVTILGIISLVYWCIDVFNNVFSLHAPLWSLWFSSVGIGLTAVALLTRNTFMLSSLFCALFVVELSWNIGFFSHLLFHKSFLGLTDYLFSGYYSEKDFIITSYHTVMLPFLLIGIWKGKTVHTHAWIGAAIFTAALTFFTYFLAGTHENTNCVHVIHDCRAFLFFLEPISNPLRTMVGVFLMTVILFIPTNYALMKFIKAHK
jgi:hypothetical protein